MTAGSCFTSGCEPGGVPLPTAVPDDRRLLARVLAGVGALALGQVAVLVLGKLDLRPGPVLGLRLILVASLGAATYLVGRGARRVAGGAGAS